MGDTSNISNPPNRGDFVSLREYLESRIFAVEKAIEVANVAMKERLFGMNEFRDTLKDQASRFVTRDEVDVKLETIHRQLKELQLAKAELEGKASQSQANIIFVIAVIGLVLSGIGLFLK